ncbi:MAG TPA: amidase family protein [Candidatus Binatia bacterium]|jgi:aspartyl-tRNA(Asn)/glutamyl-tRNA(Gln) amidotransferase subunit A|nr:amidase family protein [Candidatus Binatia bacterium]
MTDADFAWQSALDLRHAILRKEVSPVDVVRAALDRLAAVEPALNAFVTPTPDAALDAARRAEQAIVRGEATGPLAGLPISVKDVIPVAGVRFTFGSRAFADNVATADAPLVERLRAAGAALLGKTTTSEFGCKAVGDCPLTGATRNPWDVSKTAGGSSAGAAASVAAGVTPFAIGTDGGGSLRIPGALTGLFAVKPQFARVPMFPVSAAPTLGHAGVMARTVRDAALLLGVVSGFDARDAFSVAAPVPDYLAACDRGVRGMRVAWSPTLGYARPTPEVAAIAAAAARAFEALGCEVEEVDAVFDADPVEVWTTEFYTGIGTRLKHLLAPATRELLDPPVVEILSSALGRSAEAYYATVFERYALREKMRLFFERFDLLLSPTLPVVAFDVFRDLPPELPDRNLVSWVYYTYPFNLTGQPAASIPAGCTAAGLPVGLQMVSRTNAEVDLFRAAAALEAARPWAGRRPALDG